MILTDALAAAERGRGAVLHVARPGLVAHRAEYRFGERVGARMRFLDVFQGAARKRLDLIVRSGERGGGQKGERRERPVVLAAFDVRRFHHPAHHDVNLAVRLFDGEQVRDVAIGVDLFDTPAGGEDVPGERALAAGRDAASDASSERCI